MDEVDFHGSNVIISAHVEDISVCITCLVSTISSDLSEEARYVKRTDDDSATYTASVLREDLSNRRSG
jgi:hypothetical protein